MGCSYERGCIDRVYREGVMRGCVDRVCHLDRHVCAISF